jgi:hypothetical protein
MSASLPVPRFKPMVVSVVECCSSLRITVAGTCVRCLSSSMPRNPILIAYIDGGNRDRMEVYLDYRVPPEQRERQRALKKDRHLQVSKASASN